MGEGKGGGFGVCARVYMTLYELALLSTCVCTYMDIHVNTHADTAHVYFCVNIFFTIHPHD